MSSEDIDSSTHPESNSRGEEEPFPQPPPVVVPPIRIRVVSEINSPEVADTLCQFAQKRSWLASHSEAEDSTKKPKVEANSDQDTTNCELPLSNMDPGTSAGSSSPKTNATSNGQEIDKSAVAGSSAELVGGQGPVVVKQEVTIKEEPADETPSGSNDPPPTVAVAQPVNIKKESSIKEEATSSIRDSCQFGIRCYRSNNRGNKNEAQMKLLIEFMGNHPELRYKANENIWEALTVVLNRFGPPTNSAAGWKKVWRNYRFQRSRQKKNKRKTAAARKKRSRRLAKTNARAAALCAAALCATIHLADDDDDYFEEIEIKCDDGDYNQEIYYVDSADETTDAPAAAEATDASAAAEATDAPAAAEATDVISALGATDAAATEGATDAIDNAAAEAPDDAATDSANNDAVVLESLTAEKVRNAKVEYQKRMIEIFTERNNIEKTKVEVLREAEQNKIQYRKRKLELREQEIRALEERNRLESLKTARISSSD